LLAAAEILAGLLLYAVFTYITAIQWLLGIAAVIFIRFDSSARQKSKSLGSALCGITAVLVLLVDVALRITNHDVWVKPLLIGLCLMATLVFLDRRADGE